MDNYPYKTIDITHILLEETNYNKNLKYFNSRK